jgi:hypothetical protein
MSAMSTGRRPGAAVRRFSPGDAYSLLRRPGPAGSKPRPRPGRPRLHLVPPLPTGPAEGRPATPPPGRTPAPADARVPAAGAASVPSAIPAPVVPPAATTAPARVPRPGDTPARIARPRDTPARVVRAAGAPARDGRPGGTPARVVRAAGAPARDGRARRKIRLTRRGRLVVWTLAALIVAAVLTPVWLIAATGAQASNHGLPAAAVHAGMRHVVVRPGQTLWSIANAAEPTADPRVVVQEIMQVNALSGGVVVPGQSLWVPRN